MSSTYFQHQAALRADYVQYNEILDLVISFEFFYNEIKKFEVLNEQRMDSVLKLLNEQRI